MPKQTRTKARINRRKTQRGGRYISAGSYGCGFRPALRCEGEARRRRGKFSKIVDKGTAADEIIFQELLRPRDPTRQYFLYPEAICVPAPYEEADEMKKCEFDFSDREKARVIIMGKGGTNLQDLQLRASDYIPFFISLRNLFQGLQVLHADGIAHMDIKPPNIVTRRSVGGSFHTRLIDFGLTVDPDKLDTLAAKEHGPFSEYNVFLTNYIYWPFEVRFAYPGMISEALRRTRRIMMNRGGFYNEITIPRVSFPHRAFSVNQLTPAEISTLAATYDGMSNKELYKKLFPSADIHGFGITLAQIYYRFTGHRDVGTVAPIVAMMNKPESSTGTPIADLVINEHLTPGIKAWHGLLAEHVSLPLFTLIRRMVYRIPRERITLAEALTLYDVILGAMEVFLTAARISENIKSWMLQKNVLIEAGVGAGAEAASSESEQSSSPVAEVPPSPDAASSPYNIYRLSSNKYERAPNLIPPKRSMSRSRSRSRSSYNNYNSEEENYLINMALNAQRN